MASGNNNGSSWVTARHGGDGKGHAGPGGAPNPVNHTGGVNANKDADKDNDDDGQQQEDGPSLHPYHKAIADELRNKHGLSHNSSVRVGAGIVAAHAKGHASVDAATQSKAAEAHGHWNTMMKQHKKASAVSAPQAKA
jgi:hypothetical protein